MKRSVLSFLPGAGDGQATPNEGAKRGGLPHLAGVEGSTPSPFGVPSAGRSKL